jgi:NADPH:quinone reductase-like Zn-dependent oxidoreductase
MKAWRIHEHGGPDVLRLEEIPTPEPGPKEVRVRVRAVALNHLDLWVRRGVPGHTFPLPIVPGSDVSGVVDAVGPGVQRWSPGQEVLVAPGIGCGHCPACLAGDDHLCPEYGIFGETRDGGCAEFLVVPESHLMEHPPNLGPEEAASLPLVLLTAWHMLVDRARVRPGEWVLVRGGSSGVGSMSLQIARLWGARAIATVTNPDKVERVHEAGAEVVLTLEGSELRREVLRLTGGRGVDVVIDHVGQATFRSSLSCLAKGGRLVNCGATTGPKVEVDLRHIFFKDLSILGSTMGRRGELEEAMEHVRAGRLRPVVDRVFPLEELPEAHRHLEARRAVGKVVLRGFRA